MLPFCNMLEEKSNGDQGNSSQGMGTVSLENRKGNSVLNHDSGSSVKLWQCICVYFWIVYHMHTYIHNYAQPSKLWKVCNLDNTLGLRMTCWFWCCSSYRGTLIGESIKHSLGTSKFPTILKQQQQQSKLNKVRLPHNILKYSSRFSKSGLTGNRVTIAAI